MYIVSRLLASVVVGHTGLGQRMSLSWGRVASTLAKGPIFMPDAAPPALDPERKCVSRMRASSAEEGTKGAVYPQFLQHWFTAVDVAERNRK